MVSIDSSISLGVTRLVDDQQSAAAYVLARELGIGPGECWVIDPVLPKCVQVSTRFLPEYAANRNPIPDEYPELQANVEADSSDKSNIS